MEWDATRSDGSEFSSKPDTEPEDTGCGILHVDMDAFFAAVELRAYPELVDCPVLVAGSGPRSVVLSANYPARRYGVRSAIPVGMARKLCPGIVCLSPSRGLYQEISRGVLGFFAELTPLIEPLSIDEAFLDVSGALRQLNTTPAGVGAYIREYVASNYGITCSVGVAGMKFVAKLASGSAKLDGLVVVPLAQTLQFLHPLPVSALPGVGAKTEQNLRRYGVETVAQLAHVSPDRLGRLVGSAFGKRLSAFAQGRDERAVVPNTQEKSIGVEHTFDIDQGDRDVLNRELLRLSEQVASMLRAKSLRGRTVSIKVRFADFRTITRSQTRDGVTDVARYLHNTVLELLEQVPSGEIRLIGVRVEGLVENTAGEQLTFTPPDPRWRQAELAADTARDKFGAAAIRPASLLSPKQK